MYGVNQETVSIDDIDKYSLTPSAQANQIRDIKQFRGVKEVVLLSTDLRSEYYLHVDETLFKHGDLLRYLAKFTEKTLKEIILETYSKFNEDVVSHLFSVTSGMETRPKGKIQPLMAAEEALAIASNERTASFVLKDLFKTAVKYGQENYLRPAIAPIKEAEISKCLNSLRKDTGRLVGKKFVLFGDDKTIVHLSKVLLYSKAESITIANANGEANNCVIEKLSEWQLDDQESRMRKIHAVDLRNVGYRMANADVMIISSSVQHAWFSKQLLRETKELRQTKKMQVVIDMSTSQEEFILSDEARIQYVRLDDLKNGSYTEEEKEVALTYFDESLLNATDRFMEKYREFIERKDTTSIFSKLVPGTN